MRSRECAPETVKLASELFVDLVSRAGVSYDADDPRSVRRLAERASNVAWTLALEHTITGLRFRSESTDEEVQREPNGTLEDALFAIRERNAEKARAEAEELRKQPPPVCECASCVQKRAVCDRLSALIKGQPDEDTLAQAVEAARGTIGQDFVATLPIDGGGPLASLLDSLRDRLHSTKVKSF